MQYDVFKEVLPVFPMGRYLVNSFQLRNLIRHEGCTGVSTRILHVGTILLDKDDLCSRLSSDQHPRLDDIKITCLDGEIIIDNPDLGCQ